MKRISWFGVIAIVLVLLACSVNRVEKVQCVESFMQTMQAHPFTDSLLVRHISPEWLERNQLDPQDVSVNTYDPEGFTVQATDPDTGAVVVIIWGEGHKWQHRLLFKTTDDGRYILPERFEDKKITPWIKATDI